MPFINRSINLHNEPQPVYQMVKREPLDSDLLESHLEEESKEAAQGKWSDEENLKFIVFISYYQDIFTSKQKRKTCKIFKTFEEYLQGRTAAQCRSHFQKILMKFKTVAKLRKHFQQQYGKEIFREELQKFKTSWQETHPPIVTKDLFVKECKQFGIQTQNQQVITEQPVCLNCAVPVNTQPVVPSFNPYIYWNQFEQQNAGYFYCLPSQENNLSAFY